MGNRVDGDLRVTGNLSVDGSLPTIARAGLAQTVLAVFAVPLTVMRIWDAMLTILPAAGANDDLGLYTGTMGTNALKLSTGDAKAATVTRYARFQVPIPAEYDAGETIQLRVSAGMETTIADDTATVDAQVYKVDRETAVGADICATVAQDINSTTFADKTFTITPTGLTAGDMLDVRLALAVVDAATGTAVTATIAAVELLVDIKG